MDGVFVVVVSVIVKILLFVFDERNAPGANTDEGVRFMRAHAGKEHSSTTTNR